MSDLKVTDELTVFPCAKCGTKFAMQATLEQLRRKDCETIYCPNGHTMSFTKPVVTPDAERIKKLEADLAAFRKRDDALTAWVKRAPHLATCNVRVDRPCDCGRAGLVGDAEAPPVVVGN